MVIDVFYTSQVMGALMVIGAFLSGTIGAVITYVFRNKKEIASLKQSLAEHEEMINDSLTERMILLRGQKTIMEVVSQKRCNGNVEDSIREIDDYLMEKSHEIKEK